jgi:hypothetical protein
LLAERGGAAFDERGALKKNNPAEHSAGLKNRIVENRRRCG